MNWFRKILGREVEEPVAVSAEPNFREQLNEDIQQMFKVNLIEKAKTIPLSTLDGKPNPQWAQTFALGFPDLLHSEILAKQQELIDAEVALIDAFLDGENPGVDDSWIGELSPEVKIDDLGLWHIRINNQWAALTDDGVKSVAQIVFPKKI